MVSFVLIPVVTDSYGPLIGQLKLGHLAPVLTVVE